MKEQNQQRVARNVSESRRGKRGGFGSFLAIDMDGKYVVKMNNSAFVRDDVRDDE